MPSEQPKLTTIAKTLEEVGLAKNEAVLYEILLNTPAATVPNLVKNSPFSRTLLYYLLGNLQSYGLITVQNRGTGDGKKTTYSAEPPEKIADLIADREKEFKKQKDLLHNVMGDLYSTYRLAHNKPGVKFYEGQNGVLEVFDTIAGKFKPGTELISFVKVLPATYENDFNAAIHRFIKKRVAANVKTRVLAIDSEQARELKKNDAISLRETRLLPANDVPLDFPGGEIYIYDKEMYIVTVENNSYFAFKIASSAIIQMFVAFFSAHWNLLARDAV